jgi:hypothetical protein
MCHQEARLTRKIEYIPELSETVVGIQLGAFQTQGALGALCLPDIAVVCAVCAEEKLCESDF